MKVGSNLSNVDEDQIVITKWIRYKDHTLPDNLFSTDEVLCLAIIEYCKVQKLAPIYIDRNIAIFTHQYKGAYYKKDLEIINEDYK